MKRVSIVYTDEDYVEWTAWCRAKGFKGKEPIATAHPFVMVKYKNVAPMTATEREEFTKQLEIETEKMKASKLGTV